MTDRLAIGQQAEDRNMTDIPAADRVVAVTDNQSPHDAFTLALDDAYSTARDFLDGKPVETQGQADSIGRIVGEVKKIKKDADAARAEEKRPHDEAAKAVQTKWKPLLERAETIIAAAQKPLSDYLNKLAEQQREAERIAREEAARKAQEAVEASRAAQGSIEAVEHARELEKAADKATKDAKRAGKAKAHVSGMDRAIGLRTYWTATINDRRELLNWIARNDPDTLTAWLHEYADKAVRGGTRRLPGVVITEERKVA